MLFYTNISYTTFVYTSKGGLPMNIDKLIHEYYDKINELKHDYKHNADDKKCNFQIKCTIPQGFRTFFITSLFALFISFTVFLFKMACDLLQIITLLSVCRQPCPRRLFHYHQHKYHTFCPKSRENPADLSE